MQRPTAVSAFGILNVAVGTSGIVGSLWTWFVFSPSNAARNPLLNLMRESATYVQWMKIMVPIHFIASMILVTSGIGLLQLKPWARKAAIGYAIFAILVVIIGIPVNFVGLVRPLIEHARQLQGPDSVALIGGAVGAGLASALGWIYPVVLWIFMTRPNVVAAFQKPPPLPSNLT
jgi:hypothetical protein